MNGITHDAVLITDELVTNAVRHGSGETVTVGLHHHGTRVRITVSDADRSPVALPPNPTDGGRGLHIVDALAVVPIHVRQDGLLET